MLIILMSASECFEVNDPQRWLIAIISDTGMRLSEAAGLLTDDIKLDADVPHITLRKHPWRSLKTASSERDILLVGSAYDAARRVIEQDQKFAFSGYCNEAKCGASSAFAALNKLLNPRISDRCVIHSFRHSLRDRLSAVECPSGIIDAIGGWTKKGIGHAYGKGYTVDILAKWMRKIDS